MSESMLNFKRHQRISARAQEYHLAHHEWGVRDNITLAAMFCETDATLRHPWIKHLHSLPMREAMWNDDEWSWGDILALCGYQLLPVRHPVPKPDRHFKKDLPSGSAVICKYYDLKPIDESSRPARAAADGKVGWDEGETVTFQALEDIEMRGLSWSAPYSGRRQGTGVFFLFPDQRWRVWAGKRLTIWTPEIAMQTWLPFGCQLRF